MEKHMEKNVWANRYAQSGKVGRGPAAFQLSQLTHTQQKNKKEIFDTLLLWLQPLKFGK